MLLDRGADPNLAVPGDGNALIMAAREGHVDIVTLLLDRGANIDDVVDGDENALIQASGSGALEVVKLLVARGADVNARVQVHEEIRRRMANAVEHGRTWSASRGRRVPQVGGSAVILGDWVIG